jgi:RNA polymerase subunit RPABC4/transcription elongation factor Spt4
MRKTTILLIIFCLISVLFLSGCQGISDLTGGATGASSGELCIVGLIIVIIGIVAFFFVITRKGKKDTIIIHSPPPSPSTPIIVNHQPKETIEKEITRPHRRCPECGRVIPDDAKLCPYCGKKFKTHFIEEDNNEVKIVEPPKNTTEQKSIKKRPKHCPECGQKLEDAVSFCTNCGNKLDGE